MHSYGVRDVEKLLRLPRSTIRALIAAGFVAPERGPRGAYRFSFQDLIVLRTAQALVAADVPQRRITQSLKALRRRLPESMPLSGLRIRAVGDRVVVSERNGRWHAESGQYLLAFEGDPAAGALGVIEPTRAAVRARTDWFERAIGLERKDAKAAQHAYERAIAAEPDRVDARLNLGRLLHEGGHWSKAEHVYRDALQLGFDDPLISYNLAVLLEDMDRKPEAIQAYKTALRGDAHLADAHYNLALLYEDAGQAREALRHMGYYHRLTRG